MSRHKVTATVTFYVDSDDDAEALEIARDVADDLKPDRCIRYRHQPISATCVVIEPVPPCPLAPSSAEGTPNQ